MKRAQSCTRTLLRTARASVARSLPFYAHLLSRRMFVSDERIETMAVGRGTGELRYEYNSSFVRSIDQHELCGLLHHEINHIVFGHVDADRRQFPDRRARIIAEEVTVNEWVSWPLPGKPLLLEQFPELPPDEDTWTRYKRLEGQTDKYAWIDGMTLYQPWREASPRDDILDRWTKVFEGTRHSNRQWPQDVLSLLPLVRLPPAGHVQSAIPWKKLLRASGIELGPQLDYRRPPRRFPHLLGVAPGLKMFTRPRVMAAIDTSGSMSEKALQQVGRQLQALARHAKVLVVECDSKIRASYKLQGQLQSVRGRGGTDLRPPFASEHLRKIRPNVIVYFTDGKGEAPEKPPAPPVIWAVSPGGKKPVEWGREIRL